MVPARGPLSGAVQDEIIRAVRAYMQEAELGQADVARAIGQNTTYINNVLSRSAALPVDTRDQILRDLNNWLDREARARENRKPEAFVETRVARRLIDLAERLTERPDIAIAYGPAGIGKSLTADAICAELPTAVYVLIDGDCRAPAGLRDKLYNALSRRKRIRRVTMADLVEKLRPPARISTASLLVLDEAHDLRQKTLEMLRKLHDQARCSILLLGTVDLRVATSYDDDDDFGQFASRVGMRINLAAELTARGGGQASERLFTVQDIRAIFGQGKLKLHSSATRLLATIANSKRGTLRVVDRLVHWATKEAGRARANQIYAEHVRTAAQIIDVDISYADLGQEPESADALQEATA